MGQLGYNPVIQHFSHQHPLELCTTQQSQATPPCSGCKLKTSGWFYTCKTCNYTLHITCSQMSQTIHHPFDPNHLLSLLPYPAYPEGFFNCDACGRRGDGFCYHCEACGLDIHTFCASMPLSLSHQAHNHSLQLAFFPPYQNKGFSCDICKKLGANNWLYRCNICEFDAHLGCATAKPKPQPQILQQHERLPATSPQFQAFGAGSANVAPPIPNYYGNGNGPGPVVPQGVQRPVQSNVTSNNSLMNHAVQTFVDSVAQNMVQSVFGEGGGGGSGDGGNGDGGSSSSNGVSGIASSVLGNVFGGSSSTNE